LCRDIIVNPNSDRVINADRTFPPPIVDNNYCPGGIIPPASRKGRRLAEEVGLASAFIRPFEGFWIHVNPDGSVALLPCESENTCIKVEIEALGDMVAPAGAACGPNFEGFMCATCSDGYVKRGGQCAECPGFRSV
jgi:hypothetical protein